MSDVKKYLDSLALPKCSNIREEPISAINLAGNIVSRSDGFIVLRVDDASLRIAENDICSISAAELEDDKHDPTLVFVTINLGAEIQQVRTIELSPKDCDCAERLEPLLLALSANNPVFQNISDFAQLEEKRDEWARERDLSVAGTRSSWCTYQTKYNTQVGGKFKKDQQTDKNKCAE